LILMLTIRKILMNLDEYWDVTEYIVNSSKIDSYSSLVISDGKIVDSSSVYTEVNTQTERINNYMSFHSSQDIWGTNLLTKQECCLKFNDLDVSFKPGHRMKVVSNIKTGEIVRLININTGEWDQSGAFVENEHITLLSFFYHSVAIFAAFITSLLGVIFGPIIFIVGSIIIFNAYKLIDMSPVFKEILLSGVSCLILALLVSYPWIFGRYGHVDLGSIMVTNFIMIQIVVCFYMRLIRRASIIGEQINSKVAYLLKYN
jgi:hypothetical protein